MSQVKDAATVYPEVPLGTNNKQDGGLIRVRLLLSGISPLLMNAMTVEQLLDIRGRKKLPKTAARPPIREEAESKLHCLPDGKPHIPVHCLYKTLINAGQFVRLDGKRQISTDKKTILPGMLSIEDSTLPLIDADGRTARWEVDIQQGRNPNGGETVCLVRPRFDDWHLKLVIEVDQQQMPLQMARDLVDIAGKRIGLLEFSPRHKGTFGRFIVTIWEILKS